MLDLLGPVVVVPSLLLESPDDLVQLISLRLERLHLLPDGVHDGGCWRLCPRRPTSARVLEAAATRASNITLDSN